MKVCALLWFQGEADCNPSQKYAHLSFNGDHDKYLDALKQFVSDVNSDMKLETIYVGSIGSVPHMVGSDTISSRETNYGIRRALQSSWREKNILPGPVVYDIELETDNNHIHFNSPEEMIPFSNRWAAAISAGTYKTGIGRGPILQKIELGQDKNTVALTFDKMLKISDFKGVTGDLAKGWSCQQEEIILGDADIVSTTIVKNKVFIHFKTIVNQSFRLSYGIDDDGAGEKILRGMTDLPVEPFYGVELEKPSHFFRFLGD